MSVKVLAPAKINIGLQVFPKSAEYEGFHRIESLFQTVGLFDELEVGFSDVRNGGCEVLCPSMSLPKENTLTKTFDSFRKFSSIDDDRSVVVSIKKRIPAGGGLGGGSSDSAFFLKSLAELYGVELTRDLAFSVAGDVGSDVFFFLALKEGFGSALVGGRGEKVREVGCRKLKFLLVFPNVFSSTKEAYFLLDKSYEAFENGGGDVRSAFVPFSDFEGLYGGNVSLWSDGKRGFKNSFTPVMVEKYPAIGEAILDLKGAGAVFADMSGSGSTVFGVFEDASSAEKAQSALCSKWNCVLA